jgi:hypothetical protein
MSGVSSTPVATRSWYPRPAFEPTNSATMAAVAAIVAVVLRPEKITWSALGNRTCQNVCQAEAPMDRVR